MSLLSCDLFNWNKSNVTATTKKMFFDTFVYICFLFWHSNRKVVKMLKKLLLVENHEKLQLNSKPKFSFRMLMHERFYKLSFVFFLTLKLIKILCNFFYFRGFTLDFKGKDWVFNLKINKYNTEFLKK